MNPFAIDLSPHRYVKLSGSLSNISGILSPFGKKAFILFDPFIHEKYGALLTENLKKGRYNIQAGILKGECCREEGLSHLEGLEKSPPDFIVGMGGGKTIDMAKWIAKNMEKPFVSIPTSVATCAAATSISVLYTPDGHYQETVAAVPPSLTLVDPDILISQPPRLLAAGMADAMAKWIEARGMRKQHHKRILSASALSLSRLTYEFLTKRGTRALEDLKRGEWTQTLSEIVYVNLLTTGLISTLGGKAVRVSAAHAFSEAFCGTGSKKGILHGEWVTFGMIFQMVLERTPLPVINRHLFLFGRWGLPLTLNELGIDKNERLREAVIRKMVEGKSPIHNLLMPVNTGQVLNAILEADSLGGKTKKVTG